MTAPKDDDPETKAPEEGEGEAEPALRVGRREFIAATVTAAAAVAASCGGDDGPGTPDDAGSGDAGSRDGGGGEDAGRRGDAGRPRDGGPRLDAGPEADAGMPAGDAGPSDAGAAEDTGPAEDAGPGIAGPESIPESASFPLGVSSGDVTDTRAILWTRYTDTMPLELVVYEMRGDTYVREVAVVPVTPAAGGYTHHDFAGLTAGQRYRYVFFEMAGATRMARSRIGRFRAAIAPTSMERLLVGAVSCVSNSRAITTMERAGERTDLDVFLLLGDTTYNDGATTVAQYRDAWTSNFNRMGYLTTRAAVSVLASWDDHEVDNDWNPESHPAAQVANARQVYFENLPLRRDTMDPGRIWKRIRWGLTAEFFVLDCRGERSPMRNEYISRAQMDWLKSGLLDSPAVFKIILNSVPITDFPGLFDFASSDRWEGYATQRREILEHIDTMSIPGVFWVAGDFHLASAQTIATGTAPGARQFEVLVGPGAQSPNPLAGTLGAPQFRWASGTNNYSTLDLDPSTRTITVIWHRGDGTELRRETFTL